MKDRVITARVGEATLNTLMKRGEREDRTVSYLVRKAVEEYVASEEEIRGK